MSVQVGNSGARVNPLGNPGDFETLAGTMTQMALQYISSMSSGGWGIPEVIPHFPVVAAPPIPGTVSAPTMQPITWSMPTPPGTFQGSIFVPPMPTLAAVQPQLSMPTAPTPFSGSVPPTPAVDTNFTMPTLSLSLPSPPSLLQLQTVIFDGVTIPDFNLAIPTLTAVAPSAIRYDETEPYTSTLLQDLAYTLDQRITSGTNTGLPAAIETAIWDQARDKAYRQMADALAELERYEELGYAMPPGVYNDNRLKIQTEMQFTAQTLARDISIEQAKLVQTNILESLKVAVELEGKQIEYHNQIAQRVFESTKYATEATIAIYNAQVEAYKGNVEGYKASIGVYDARIRGLEAQVNVYKTEIDAEMVKAEINKSLVDEYHVMSEVALSAIEVYKAEIEGIRAQAEIQKLVVEIYGSQIQAFVATVNAFTAEIEAYKAGVQAQGEIQQTYKIAVDAFAAEVNATATEINANVEVFKGNLAAVQEQAEVYKAIVIGQAEQAKAISESNTSAAEVYKAEVAAITSYNEVLVQEWKAIVDENERIAEVGVQAAKANGDLYIAARGLSLDASKVAAQVAAQIAAAALNAVHFSTSVSASGASSNVTEQITSSSQSSSV